MEIKTLKCVRDRFGLGEFKEGKEYRLYNNSCIIGENNYPYDTPDDGGDILQFLSNWYEFEEVNNSNETSLLLKANDKEITVEYHGRNQSYTTSVPLAEGETSEEAVKQVLETAQRLLGFVPYLYSEELDSKYGEIGEETPYTDALGRKLHVGDIVEIYSDDNICMGKEFVVEDEKTGKPFIMGICWNCDHLTGNIADFKVILTKGYKDLVHGEKVGDLEVILHERRAD